MPSYNEAFYLLKNQLRRLYDVQEAAAITHELLLHITGLDKMQRLMNKDQHLTQEQQQKYEHCVTELLTGKPIQYVTGIAWFKGNKYEVNESVLIPRPETEELVDWLVSDYKSSNEPISVLDIGAGSGCIPIAIKLALPLATITSCDISNDALIVANTNANNLAANIAFLQIDFLNINEQNKLGMFSVVVSNPPYIPFTDKQTLHPNVRDYEPEIALFVPGDNPLLFYKAIALFGKSHLHKNGAVYCEIHSSYAMECVHLFEEMNYISVEIRKDIFGKPRMLKAVAG